MKRIGFSIAGEGRGHAARAVALSEFLQEEYEVVYFCPGSIQGFIRSHIPDAHIETIPILDFVKKGHAIDYWRTGWRGLKQMFGMRRHQVSIDMRLQELQIQALVSDFEPFVSRAAARKDIPIINLNHPGVVLNYLSLVPDAWAAQAVATLMMPPAQQTLLCSFYRGNVGPIIRKELRVAQPQKDDFILVYAKDSSRERIESILEQFPRETFVVFPRTDQDFTQALIHCKAVIAPAGHQLTSEALFLGKPILAIPQRGQFEQRLNAKMLVKSGRGVATTMKRFSTDLELFLAELDTFPRVPMVPHAFCFQDRTKVAADLISAFVESQTACYVPRRVQYTWFASIPEKIDYMRSIPPRPA